jgi:DNA-binding protein Fis
VGGVESILLAWALKRVGGVRLRAAELLGIHRNTLRKKLDGGVEPEAPRDPAC